MADNTTTVRTLKDLQKEVKGYKDQLANLDRGTKEYNDTLARLAEQQGKINSINQDVQSSTQNLTQVWSNVAVAASGVAAGFGAVTAATALLGEENEDLVNTLVKVQAGLALTQQLSAVSKGIKAATTAFKAFNVTLSASTIGLIAVGVTALAAGITALTKAFKNNKEELDRLNRSFERNNELVNGILGNIDYQINQIKRRSAAQRAAGVEETKILAGEINSYQDLADSINDTYQAEADRLDNLKELSNLTNISTSLTSGQAKRYTELATELGFVNDEGIPLIGLVKEGIKQIPILEENVSNLSNAIGDLNKTAGEGRDNLDNIITTNGVNNIKQLTEQANKIIEQARIERLDALDAESYIIEKEYKKRRDILIAANKDTTELDLAYSKQLEANQEKRNAKILSDQEEAYNKQNSLFESQLADRQSRFEEADAEFELAASEALLNGTATIDELNAKRLDNRLKQQEELNELYEAELLRLDEIVNNTELDEEIRSAAAYRIIDIERNRAIATLEIQTELNKSILDSEEKLAKRRLAIRRQLFKDTSSILDSASKLLGESTEAGKAAAIASTTIATYQSATESYKALAGIPVVGPGLGAAAAAAAIASGLANVKQITSTSTNGTATPTQVNYTYIPSIPSMYPSIQETHNNLSTLDENFLSNVMQPVLVVEDLNQVEGRIRVAEEQSTF